MKTSYEDGYRRAQADIAFEKNLCGGDTKAVVQRMARIYSLRLKRFYIHGGEDYKVIVTRFDRGYMAALKDAEEGRQ